MSRLGRAVAVALLLAGPASAPGAEIAEDPPRPRATEGVGVVERLGERLPDGLEFTGTDGQPFRLAAAFGGERPVVLVLAYFDCPMLCGLVLAGITNGLKDSGLELGQDYDLLTVSIDPRDTPAKAAQKQGHHLQAIGHPGERARWRFLVGSEASIKPLAEALGFQYRFDERSGQFAHPAVVFVLTPDGRVSRYLYGLDFPRRQLRLALVEASGGRVGGSFDRFLLTCFHYDPASRRYAFFISNYLRAGGLLVLLGLSTMLVTLWRRERRRSASA